MHLSIIIPTYNRGDRIADSLSRYIRILEAEKNSIGLTLEYLVVDDGSRDGTWHALSGLAESNPNLKAIRLPENAGPGPARDAGVAQARGDWIWFLDDDDEIDPTGLCALLLLLAQNDNECDLIAHSLKKEYRQHEAQLGRNLGRNVLLFKEKQEVFNYLIRRNLIQHHDLTFAQGLHEDIRYVFDVIRLAKQIRIVPHSIIRKHVSADAITAGMSDGRIDGYLQAYREILRQPETKNYVPSTTLLVQTLGVILYLIAKEASAAKALHLLSHLREKMDQSWLASQLSTLPEYAVQDSNFKYASSVLIKSKDVGIENLLGQIKEIFNSRLSCKDLNSSLFLGPDEIRACCKRFFVNGIRKGDVVLLKAKEDITLTEIQAAKDDLTARMNADEAPECFGCPYIERAPKAEHRIDYISLENFSYCNMRCTYCSPKYYGGTEAKYSATDILTQLAALTNSVQQDCHVVWGGGEPTLSKHFEPINRLLNDTPQVKKIRILTNSLKYSPPLNELLTNEKFQIVTSIDAGTPALFKEIRGKGGIDAVVENLQHYRRQMSDKRRLTVKYIMQTNNASSEEIGAYVEKMVTAGMMDSMFQISCDFTLPDAHAEMADAIYELAVRLYMAGAQIVFFDDLIRDRLRLDQELVAGLLKNLREKGLDESHVLTPASDKQVVLWGVGKQSEWYRNRTTSGEAQKIKATVGTAADLAPYGEIMASENAFIFPSGVQSMYEIVRNIEAAGLGHRIARFVIA